MHWKETNIQLTNFTFPKSTEILQANEAVALERPTLEQAAREKLTMEAEDRRDGCRTSGASDRSVRSGVCKGQGQHVNYDSRLGPFESLEKASLLVPQFGWIIQI